MVVTINKALVALVTSLAQVPLYLADSSAGGADVVAVEVIALVIGVFNVLGVYAVAYAAGPVAPAETVIRRG